MQPHTTYTMH